MFLFVVATFIFFAADVSEYTTNPDPAAHPPPDQRPTPQQYIIFYCRGRSSCFLLIVPKLIRFPPNVPEINSNPDPAAHRTPDQRPTPQRYIIFSCAGAWVHSPLRRCYARLIPTGLFRKVNLTLALPPPHIDGKLRRGIYYFTAGADPFISSQ